MQKGHVNLGNAEHDGLTWTVKWAFLMKYCRYMSEAKRQNAYTYTLADKVWLLNLYRFHSSCQPTYRMTVQESAYVQKLVYRSFDVTC